MYPGLDLRMFKVFNLGVKPTFELARSRGSATFLPSLLLLLIAVATTYLLASYLWKPTATS